MSFKNTAQLLPNDLDEQELKLRKIGLKSLEIAIDAVRPKNLMENSIKLQNNLLIINNDEYNLSNYSRIIILGGGKATYEMAYTLEQILIKHPVIEYKGIINILSGQETNLGLSKKITLNLCSHPVPEIKNLSGTKDMLSLIQKGAKNDLIITLISGGGSALLTLPKEGISLEDIQKINSLLLASGASIHEINTIRKHLSDFKGGNLARRIHERSEATIISLIISDVVGDNLDTIASGPTVPDSTTFSDAMNILNKYNLIEKIPNSIIQVIEKGLKNEIPENPKYGDDCFNNVKNYLIGSVKNAVSKVQEVLKEESFKVEYFSNKIAGEAQDFGVMLYRLIKDYSKKYLLKGEIKKLALIGTGELTVTIKGKGTGGRNQEMLLSFLDFIKEKAFEYKFLIIGANLDGIEGNSKALGAIIDNNILNQIKKGTIDLKSYLTNNDSNTLFKKLGTEIITGPTGCNVNDLLLILVQK